MRTRIAEIYKDSGRFIGRHIKVAGWARTLRDQKTFGFIELNDGSFFKGLQVVFDDTLQNFAEVAKLGVGAAVTVEGTLTESIGAKQPFELKAESVAVDGFSPPEYPLQKKRHSMEFLREIAHLRSRTNTFGAVFRVRSLCAFAIHKFFNERGFVYIHTPIITASDCEGAGEMFRVTTLDPDKPARDKDGAVDFNEDFFGKPANLTVSGQLSAEALSMAFADVYTFGPTFRAEISFTPRHGAEFYMIEPEIAFADLNDDMNLAEDMLKYVIKYVMENAPEEMAFFNEWIEKGLIERLNHIVNSDFARVTYGEATQILEGAKKQGEAFEYPVGWGHDLQTEHERYLTEKHFKKPVFVTDWPKEIKAFYMRRNDDGKTVAAVDLLVSGVGELIGGSQREERLEVLLEAMSAAKLNPDDYWWYLELRKYGGCKHAGFGLGFERLVMYLTGMQNIRDVIPFPRTTKNAEF